MNGPVSRTSASPWIRDRAVAAERDAEEHVVDVGDDRVARLPDGRIVEGDGDPCPDRGPDLRRLASASRPRISVATTRAVIGSVTRASTT